jgi:hypothetical protein
MKERNFSNKEFTIMQMICEYAHAKHSDQLELFTYFNPEDVNTLGFFKDTNFASQYSREFFDWIFRIDHYVDDVPEFSGYDGELRNLSKEDKETIVELSDDFFKVFEIEDHKANVEEQGFQVYLIAD